MTKETLTKADLAQFTGTENWYRHQIARNILYTDGIRYMAQSAGAYWLIDEIAFHQGLSRFENQKMQVWKLKVDLEKSTAVLSCEDGNYNKFFEMKIPFTDFPLNEITIWFTENVILLPSEY